LHGFGVLPSSHFAWLDTVTVSGRVYRRVYDAATLTFTTTSPDGRQDSTVLDAKGRIVNQATPGFHPVTFIYDSSEGLSATCQGSGPESRTSTITYNARGYPETITDSLQRTTSFTSDLAGRVPQQTLPGGRVIAYEYDANGNVTAVTPPSNPLHGFAFDSVDLLSDYVPPVVAPLGTRGRSTRRPGSQERGSVWDVPTFPGL